MNPISPAHWNSPGIFALFLVLGYLAYSVVRRRRRTSGRKGILEVRPGNRSFLRRLGLTAPEHFLALPSVTISGHPDRNVSRVTLDENSGASRAIPAFLKREHRVPWSVRLRNALAGFGWVSRSLRECRVLQTLERECLPGPDWIAAGEDGQGRAFLLLRENTGVQDLRLVLRDENDPRLRRRLARLVGETVARLHHKGFTHPDLYANHVLVRRDGGEVVLLDWQRTRSYYQVSWARRGRDLAALQVTLAAEFATERERWCCLFAYLAEAARLTLDTGQTPIRSGRSRRPECAELLRGLRREVQRRLRHRHVREKRQHGLTQAKHDWLRLDDEALCVSPLLARYWPGVEPAALALDRQPILRVGVSRRWAPLPDQPPVLLTRRSGGSLLSSGWTRLFRQRWSSPEQRQSVLLLRLQRHGLPVLRVLAMGQREKPGGHRDSFLLTAPYAQTLRLDLWLQRQARTQSKRSPEDRREILRQAGATLAQLHQACCYLSAQANASVFAVRVDEEPPAPVLSRVEWICPRRSRSAGRTRRDHACFLRLLAGAGCDLQDLREFDLGYRRQCPDPDRLTAPGPARTVGQAHDNRKEAAACQV
jgi:tRNA A-37 threonylcarbamoyl transferase component Bud32